MGRRDVEDDAHAVRAGADEQRSSDDRQGRDDGIKGESDGQIRPTSHLSFPEGALAGGDAVDEGRQVVIQPPEQARQEHEGAGRESRSSAAQR